MIAGSSLIFFHSYEICFVFGPHNLNFDLKLTSDPKIQPAITGKTVAFDFAHHGHALVTLYIHFFKALIGQNLTGELMRKIYAAF